MHAPNIYSTFVYAKMFCFYYNAYQQYRYTSRYFIGYSNNIIRYICI